MNLDLAVVGRRPDGYHELRSHMQAIDLHDLLLVEPAQETSISITGDSHHEPASSTVLAAHLAVEAAAHRKLPTGYWLHKRIPPGSGLGGASSDAAAAVRALVAMYQLELDLGTIAQRVGADVPFFIRGGAALTEGMGERVQAVAVEARWFAIAWPGIELSTAAVYAAWDRVGGEAPNELRRAAGLVDNRVEEFAARLGDGWQMTGSGSAFFRICSDRSSALAATQKLECWSRVSEAVGPWA